MKKLSTTICALILSVCAFADNAVTVPQVAVKAGETVDVVVNLATDVAVTAYQMDVVLPEGFSLVAEDVVPATGRFAADHQTAKNLKGNVLRVLSYSMTNANLLSNEGALLTLRVKADAAKANGNYNIEVKNVIATAYDAEAKAEQGYDLAAVTGTIVVCDDPAGINAVEASSAKGQSYNIAGQKVDDNFRGIVVEKGKKVIK